MFKGGRTPESHAQVAVTRCRHAGGGTAAELRSFDANARAPMSAVSETARHQSPLDAVDPMPGTV